MAVILDGKQVAVEISGRLTEEIARLAAKNIRPALTIVRMGENASDMSYERGAVKRCESVGIAVSCVTLSQTAPQSALLDVIAAVNADSGIHGCLLLRPFPAQIDDSVVRNALAPEKDIDGITDASLAGVLAGINTGFPPCTPRACMEILAHYNINISGKKAVVIGRSLVVGKPAAMMLLHQNATVTVCHTKTADMPAICRDADILIVSAGRAKIIGAEYLSERQVVVDVGINADENGKLCGDVDFTAAEPVVKAITPVPGGVGAVTTSILAQHTVEAAKRMEDRVR